MMRWLDRMKIAHRLLVIGVAFIPIAVMMHLIVTRISNDIAFSQFEQYGNAYQRPLEVLLERIPEHRLLALRYRTGNPSLERQMRSLQTEIDGAFRALAAVDAQLGVALQFTDEGLAQRKRQHVHVASVAGEWGELVRSVATAPISALSDAHAHLVSDIRTMITHEGDTSNLILDPDLDSYYTMDATLIALPQTQDRLATMIGFGEEVLRRKTLTEKERIQLAVSAAALKESDLDRIAGDVGTALNEDHNFLGTSETLQRNLPPAFQAYAAATEAFIAITGHIVGQSEVDVDPDAFVSAGTKARDASFALWRIAADELDTVVQTRIDHHKKARLNALGLGALAAATSVIIVLFVARSITGQLRQASRALAEGAEQVTATALQVSASSQSLSQGSSEQAASLEETSASIEEMSSMTQQNADNSARAAGLMAQVDGRVKAWNQSLATMVVSMDRIRESSERVSVIIKTIDEIAFQTNILALNAAVEAARAGEAGVGFSVVADEVRGLAQRSAAAAGDTASLIEESITRARDGSRTVEAVCGSIAAITDGVTQAKALIDQVSVASQQQAQGIDQVSQAVAQMETITQSTAATAEETAASSAELNAQAESTKELVVRLRALVDRGSAAAATALSTNAQSISGRRSGTARDPLPFGPAKRPRSTVVHATAPRRTGTY